MRGQDLTARRFDCGNGFAGIFKVGRAHGAGNDQAINIFLSPNAVPVANKGLPAVGGNDLFGFIRLRLDNNQKFFVI